MKEPFTYAEGLRIPPECHVPVLVEHDGRSVVALSADGRRAGSEREIPINHRRRTGAAEQESERARSHSVSPSVRHSFMRSFRPPPEREISQTFLLIREFK